MNICCLGNFILGSFVGMFLEIGVMSLCAIQKRDCFGGGEERQIND